MEEVDASDAVKLRLAVAVGTGDWEFVLEPDGETGVEGVNPETVDEAVELPVRVGFELVLDAVSVAVGAGVTVSLGVGVQDEDAVPTVFVKDRLNSQA